MKNGEICKYTKNGTELCSHILYILLNKVQLEEDDCRLNKIAYTTTELMCMLGKFAIKSPCYQRTGQTSASPASTKKCGEWKLQRTPRQGGPKPKCKGRCKGVFKAGELCVAVVESTRPSIKIKTATTFRLTQPIVTALRWDAYQKQACPRPKPSWLTTTYN